MLRRHSIVTRIAVASMLVAVVAMGVIAAGVLLVGSMRFNSSMDLHPADVNAVFTQSVVVGLVVALGAAVVISAALAVLLARWLSRPMNEIGGAARRIAGGEYGVRVPRGGPEEIAAVADSFNQMADSLEEQERIRSEFIANAAHELRTPLTNLQGYLEGLRDGVLQPSREIFSSLHEESDRLVRLAASLEILSEGAGQSQREAVEDVDLVAAIRSAVELASPGFIRRGITVHVDLPRRLRARVHPDHLAQVLANLFQNAGRYTPDGGEVTVSAEIRSTTALVRLSNTGPAIPAADIPHLFERFYRVEKSRDRVRGGAGIGLAIVKQLVEAAGGVVGADSAPEQTRFWFSLPRA
jgi:two-component system sensor histidine kinase BaeS